MPYGPVGQRVRFEKSAAPGEIARHLTMMASQHFIIVANEIRDEITTEIDSLVERDMVTDRDGPRRKRGQRHLKGSFEVSVTPTANNFPIKIVVKSRAEGKKVAALEFGAATHSIYPNQKKFLYFPYNPGGNARSNAYRARGVIGKPKVGSRGGTGNRVFLAKRSAVTHPGNRAYGFMRKGVERVVERRLH